MPVHIWKVHEICRDFFSGILANLDHKLEIFDVKYIETLRQVVMDLV